MLFHVFKSLAIADDLRLQATSTDPFLYISNFLIQARLPILTLFKELLPIPKLQTSKSIKISTNSEAVPNLQMTICKKERVIECTRSTYNYVSMP